MLFTIYCTGTMAFKRIATVWTWTTIHVENKPCQHIIPRQVDREIHKQSTSPEYSRPHPQSLLSTINPFHSILHNTPGQASKHVPAHKHRAHAPGNLKPNLTLTQSNKEPSVARAQRAGTGGQPTPWRKRLAACVTPQDQHGHLPRRVWVQFYISVGGKRWLSCALISCSCAGGACARVHAS
jgi:hypothetical protein